MRRFWLLALVLILTGGLVVPASASAAFRYKGKTSLGGSVNILIANDGNKVVSFKLGFNAGCRSGESFSDFFKAGPKRLNSELKLKLNEYEVEYDLSNGNTLKAIASAYGQFKSSEPTARGTFKFEAGEFNSAGELVDYCNIGRISWKAELVE